MRTPRIKPKGRDAVFHCISRVAGGELLLGNPEKEKFRQIMWRLADFCDVKIINYCVMSNHFHLVVKVPGEDHPSDQELLRRVYALYGKKHPTAQRATNEYSAREKISQDLRAKLTRRMADLSSFMQELKQYFSRWYNKKNNRFGTLWAERFRSSLIEETSQALRIVAAYVDLNPVRAGLVDDSKDYRFCGYGEAIAGGRRAREGLLAIHAPGTWSKVSKEHRKLLLVKSGVSGNSSKIAVEPNMIRRELESGCGLTPAQLLRLRIRYISDGLVLGSANFVNEVFAEFRDRFGPKRKTGARKMVKALSPLGLFSARDLRLNPIGPQCRHY